MSRNLNLSFSFIIIICLSLSCHTRNKTYEVKISNGFRFQISHRMLPETKCMEYYDGALYMLNNNSKDIHVLSENKPEQIIPTSQEGPQNIGVVKGFKILNDSVVLITANGFPGYALIDLEGDILQKVNLGNKSHLLHAPYNSSSYFNKVILLNTGMLFGQTIPGSWPNYTQEQLDIVPIERWYSFKDNMILDLPIYYPTDYMVESKHSFYQSRIHVEGQLIYSFAFSDKISVFDFDELEGKPSNRRDFKIGVTNGSPLLSEPSNVGIDEYLEALCRKRVYQSIYWDGINRLYYQVGYFEELDEKLASIPSHYLVNHRTAPFVLIINDKFEKVGEVQLPREKYNLNMSFVEEGGLFIARWPEVDNPIAEDLLIFDKLTFE